MSQTPRHIKTDRSLNRPTDRRAEKAPASRSVQPAQPDFFAEEKPEYVFLAAAKVGGIVANQEALADFMWFNMTLEMNVIHSAWRKAAPSFGPCGRP